MYDVIIIGAGASGLFSAANHKADTKGLILEKSSQPGTKLLMSGAGQCNFTHAGDIKDFLSRYGQHGSKIRTALYKFNNLAAINYFESKGIQTLTREDGKVFPASLKAKDILDVLVRESSAKGFEIRYNSAVDAISQSGDVNTVGVLYTVYVGNRKYFTKKLIIATGGCSYPGTGSDGKMFEILRYMGISIVTPKPALVPIFVQNYPYSSLAGISFDHAEVSITGAIPAKDQSSANATLAENQSSTSTSTISTGNQSSTKKQTEAYQSTGAVLFTHDSFSGPAVLNVSRYATPGFKISINYLPGRSYQGLIQDMKKAVIGNKKSIHNFLAETFCLPVRFAEIIIARLNLSDSTLSLPSAAASLSGEDMKRIAEILTSDTFAISGICGFNEAMSTAGGVSLDKIDLKTFESKKYPRMFIIGEALDIDGDTGGYNIQFAFSSGYAASHEKITPSKTYLL